ncbi:MAG: NIL domain-containing protein [Candidatus Omnitrophota bacterium]|nr:NIL domain-containing protein [Candidatus Omnitrophota bacterium]MBU1894481.1 NIL domain-containing protein [Candidatus Omnitrophota bacterium]
MGVKKIELFIPGELKEEPILYHMIKNFDVSIKIIEASFSTESGWAYLIVNGEESEINKLFSFLKEKHISVEVKEK